jgi:hypothetical protein
MSFLEPLIILSSAAALGRSSAVIVDKYFQMGLPQKMVLSPREEAKAASSVTVLSVCLAELTHKTQNQQCSLLLSTKMQDFLQSRLCSFCIGFVNNKKKLEAG